MWPFSKFRRLEAEKADLREEVACLREQLESAEDAFLTVWAELKRRNATGESTADMVEDLADQIGLRTLQ